MLAEALVERLLFRCGNKSCIFIFNKMSPVERLVEQSSSYNNQTLTRISTCCLSFSLIHTEKTGKSQEVLARAGNLKV